MSKINNILQLLELLVVRLDKQCIIFKTEPRLPLEIKPIKNSNQNKPFGGLWTSTYTPNKKFVSDWHEWCFLEGYNTPEPEDYAIILDINPSAKILHLTDEDINPLLQKYPRSETTLDYEKISEEYDAVHIVSDATGGGSMAFYGAWDAESTVFFRPVYKIDRVCQLQDLVKFDKLIREYFSKKKYNIFYSTKEGQKKLLVTSMYLSNGSSYYENESLPELIIDELDVNVSSISLVYDNGKGKMLRYDIVKRKDEYTIQQETEVITIVPVESYESEYSPKEGVKKECTYIKTEKLPSVNTIDDVKKFLKSIKG